METLQLDTRGPVTWVWLNRPERLNSLDSDALTELCDTFEALSSDDTVRAVVLAARGPIFSAGFDVQWMAGLDAETVRRELAGIRRVYDTVESCTKPVIAAIHGPAVGGGFLLMLTTDIRLASDRASFAAPEVRIGIFPSLDLVPRLERIVGLGMAKRMVLTGETMPVSEAERAGLVQHIVPAGSLYEEAGALGEQLAALPPGGVQAAKEAFAASRRPGHAEWEIEAFAACFASPDREAAMQAFLESG